MPEQAIPDRQPIADVIHGVIVRLGDTDLLASHPLETTETIAEGIFVIRYGIHFLGKPHIAIIPDMVVLDYGEMISGEDVWDFLVNDSNVHPRADVLGYRHDGHDEMLMVRDLDFGIPFAVYAYARADDTSPITELKAFISSQVDAVPERLLKYLPHYATLADWQNAR